MTKAANTHDIELVLPTGESSGFMLAVTEDGTKTWRRRTISLTPGSAPEGPASTQTFPPEIRQEIKLRTGHAGIGITRHVEQAGWVGLSQGVDTRFEDIFLPGPKPHYVDEVDILQDVGAMETFTSTVPDSWAKIGSPTTAQETTIVHGGGSSVSITSTGAGDGLEYSLTHANFQQCRVTAHGYVYVPTGEGDPTLQLNDGSSPVTSSPSTKDEWVEVTLRYDVGTTALSDLDLELLPATNDQMYADDWTVYIEYFVGPPGPFLEMDLSGTPNLFMASGQTFWKANRTTEVWVAQDVAPADIVDAIEHNGAIYTALGASNNWERSTDGSTFSANALTGDDSKADGFAKSTNQIGIEILWKWLGPNKLAASTTPTVAGSWMHWTIGDTDTEILDVVEMQDGSMLIIKEDGVYPLPSTGFPYNAAPSWRRFRWEKQGYGAAEWLGRAYVPAGRSSIWEFDFLTNTHRKVNAATFGAGPSEYGGRASEIIGDGSWLYAFQLEPGNGGFTQLLAGRTYGQGWRWAHLARLDAGEVKHSHFSNIIGVGPRLYFSSQDLETDTAAQASTSSAAMGAESPDNAGGREWTNSGGFLASDSDRVTWPDESVLATAETAPGTEANEDYTPGVAWSDPGNAATLDATYATAEFAAADTGAQTPGAQADPGSEWGSESNVETSDDAYANASVIATQQESTALELTGLGLSVPTGAVITGVEVSLEHFRTTGEPGEANIALINSGVIGTKTIVKSWVAGDSSAESTDTVGSATNALGATLTPAIVNSSTFGVAVYAKHYTRQLNNFDYFLDHVTVTVHYRQALSDGLRVTNFGFSLPAEATIRGVTVFIVKKASAASRAHDYNVQLVVGGSLSGANKAISTDIQTSDLQYTYGDESDLWGQSLSRAQVVASNFGVEYRAEADADEGDVTVSVDRIRIKVSYTQIETSDYLELDFFGDLEVPTSATIDGIKVELERSGPLLAGGQGSVKDNTIQMLKAGTAVGNNKADTVTSWPENDAVKTYGGSTDLWGTTWSASDFDDADFGVRIAVDAHVGLEQALVDYITVTVYYTPGGGSELNNRLGWVPIAKTENPRYCDCYTYESDVTMRTGIINRFPGWKTAWEEVIIKTSPDSGEALGSGGRQVKVRYNIFDGNGWQEVGGSGNNVITTSPLGTLYFKSADVSEVVSEDIEIEIEIEHTSGVPVVEEISVVGTVRPPAVDIFEFTVITSDNIAARGGRTMELAANQRAVLRGLKTPDWTFTLYDRFGDAHECFVLTDGGVDEHDILDYKDTADTPKVMSAVSLVMFKVPNSESWPS